MNKQGPNGIGWCTHTNNPSRGCFHDCQWEMASGEIAVCYAGAVAEGMANTAYPQGFEHYYWRPSALKEPANLKTPARIFWASMADQFGHWVPSDHIQQVLDVCRDTPWHTHLFLTKHAARLQEFDFPSNCHVGISAPPTFMQRHRLSVEQQRIWLVTACRGLSACNARVRWLSAEPLSFNLKGILSQFLFDWIVIGAASRGKAYYQPEPEWVRDLTDEAQRFNVPVFYKGNLRSNPGAVPWLEQFPDVQSHQQELFG
jgi:protein gp37